MNSTCARVRHRGCDRAFCAMLGVMAGPNHAAFVELSHSKLLLPAGNERPLGQTPIPNAYAMPHLVHAVPQPAQLVHARPRLHVRVVPRADGTHGGRLVALHECTKGGQQRFLYFNGRPSSLGPIFPCAHFPPSFLALLSPAPPCRTG